MLPRIPAVLMALFLAPAAMAAEYDAAVGSLPSGWSSETLYQGDLGVYPGLMAELSDGRIVIYDRGTLRLTVLATDGSVSEYGDVSDAGTVTAMAYQPGNDRLLLANSTGALYAYGNSALTRLKRFGVVAYAMAVDPTDDSFYAGVAAQGFDITHYDADGNSLGTVVSKVDGVFQLALDTGRDLLYFSETYAGTVSSVSLNSGSVTTLVDGVGIAGTSEPIAVALDGSNNLYYAPAADGLFRYANGTSTQVVADSYGAGMVIWSGARGHFVQTVGAGAALLGLNQSSNTATLITPFVNALAIAQLSDGTVVMPDFSDSKLLTVSNGALITFSDGVGMSCNAFARDSAGAVYAGCGNSIYSVAASGTMTAVTDFGSKTIASLAYDPVNRDLIAVVHPGEGASSAELWRADLSNPFTLTKLDTLSGATTGPTLPGVTADTSGNLYVLERAANVIYRYANGTTPRQTFASSVLSSEAITVPAIAYVDALDGLLVSTIANFELWPLANPQRQEFASNAGGVDNFALFETLEGSVLAVHSGQVFRMSASEADDFVCDINGDGRVDASDARQFKRSCRSSMDLESCDRNEDGRLGMDDYQAFLQQCGA